MSGSSPPWVGVLFILGPLIAVWAVLGWLILICQSDQIESMLLVMFFAAFGLWIYWFNWITRSSRHLSRH